MRVSTFLEINPQRGKITDESLFENWPILKQVRGRGIKYMIYFSFTGRIKCGLTKSFQYNRVVHAGEAAGDR